MLKTHSLIILFAVFSSSLCSQNLTSSSSINKQNEVESKDSFESNDVQSNPRFKFEQETIDYGKIEQNSNGLRSFNFENIGKKPLIIHRIETSCGCTIAKKPEKAVLPSEEDRIVVRYNTVRPGFFQKSLKIYYNHSTDSIKRISIKGTVIKETVGKEQSTDSTSVSNSAN